MTFELPGVEGKQIFFGKIKNLNLDERIISIGVQFDGLDEVIQGKIDAYIDSVSEFFSS